MFRAGRSLLDVQLRDFDSLIVIAGPLGAGKTTFYDAHLKEAFPTLVPPIPHQREAMLRERRSFAVEDLVVDTELLEKR